MIRINLLPVKEIQAAISRRQEIVFGCAALVLTALLILGVYGVQFFKMSGLNKSLATLKKEVEVLDVKLKEVGDLQERVKALDERVKVIDELSKKKVGPVRVMESLSSAVPPRLWLTDFKETGGNLTLNGLAVDNQTIADFLRAIGNYPYFQNVDLVETTQTEQAGVPLKRFTIRAKLFYQPPPPPQPKPAGKAAAPAKEVKK